MGGLPSIGHEPPTAGATADTLHAGRGPSLRRLSRGPERRARICVCMFQRGHPRGTSGSVSVPSSPPGAHGMQGHVSVISMSLESALKERVLRSQSAPPPSPRSCPHCPGQMRTSGLPTEFDLLTQRQRGKVSGRRRGPSSARGAGCKPVIAEPQSSLLGVLSMTLRGSGWWLFPKGYGSNSTF